ncbi:TetR family transcriptional regulator C-terminal domain-containing protein [Pseudonocardia spinosispora]|uniref:TetR family transcriptional regulator C-terminal domain-containing protein n=1 Tax=Pseudonocardia spinosispora TaxID=103441 RepID=UPI0004049F04|nr:TetR family transcriptional regulator C-terminal domain-containing protein [Pseudonocardia spinosispora]
MIGYREIADSLRARIRAGEFPVGARLPGISALQAEYGDSALNTVRAAQQVLVKEGMLATRRGVGAFVTRVDPVEDVDVLGTLRQAGAALGLAIAALEASGVQPAAVVAPGDQDEPEPEAGLTTRRGQILAAACRVIARYGVRGLRIEAVAEEAGVSTALIYHHFGDRSGLVTHAMMDINERLATRSESPAGGTGRQRLMRRMVNEFSDEGRTRENSAVWGEIRGAAVFDEKLRPTSRDATEHWVGQLAELIAQGRADGSLAREVDPRDVATRLTAMVEGLSNRWLAGLMTTEEAHRHIAATVSVELD